MNLVCYGKTSFYFNPEMEQVVLGDFEFNI